MLDRNKEMTRRKLFELSVQSYVQSEQMRFPSATVDAYGFCCAAVSWGACSYRLGARIANLLDFLSVSPSCVGAMSRRTKSWSVVDGLGPTV